MNNDYLHLMQQEIDGTITERKRALLQKFLAENPAARTEYEEMRKLYTLLDTVQEIEPPHSLKADIMTAIPTAKTVHHIPLLTHLEVFMASTIKSFFSTKRAFILGGAVVAIFAIVYLAGIYPPPADESLGGTIGAAKKYHSSQIKDKDVVLKNAALMKALQNDKVMKLLKNKAFCSAVASKAFTSMITNPEIVSALTSAEVTSYLQNPAVESYLSNPEVQSYLENPAVQSYLTNPGVESYLQDPAVQSYLADPAVQSYLTNPEVQSYLTNPEVTSFLTARKSIRISRIQRYSHT